jgi:hypothetical protein
MHKYRIKTIRYEEQGFASIVIALVLIIILGLLTVGFAQLARREQQNSLDKQLASQAYDAAESGVNDAYHDITTIDTSTGNDYINSTNVPSPNTCITPTSMPLLSPSADTYNSSINSQNGVSYTCLLVNLQPPNLLYDNVFPDTSRTVDFSTPATNARLHSLTFTWNTADAKTTVPPFPAGTGGFPPVSSWNSPAVLQISLTPLPATGLDRASLINNTFTAYLYPSNSSTPISYAQNNSAPQDQGLLVPSSCTAQGTCTGTITTIEGSPLSSIGEWYNLHIIDYYDESQNIIVTGKDTNNAAIQFIGQDQIDVTGKARYVLKRLQERVQPNTLPTLPNYALEAQDVCKRFSTYPAATTPDTSFPILVNCSSFTITSP